RTVLAGAAASLLPARTFAAAPDPVVQTRLGRIRGLRESGASVFRGIRYGNAERFRAPQLRLPSPSIIDAFAFGPSAPQRDARYRPQSEDCLFLNVWTPDARRGAKLPVMVYFHGGAFSNGSVADLLNAGRRLAAHGVATVTVNHRLNALG